MADEALEHDVVAPAAETPDKSAADTAAGEGTPEAKAASERERESDGKFRKPVQPRIDELTRKARENEREAAYWRQRAEAKEAKDNAPAPLAEPKLDQFTDYNEYVKAQARYEAKVETKTALEAAEKRQTERAQAQRFASAWNERVTDAKAKHSDYEAVVTASDVEVLDHVKDVINDSDVGPELVYHLATHPEIAQRLNRMTPLGAAREMGRLEASLNQAPAPAAEPDAEPAVPDPSARPPVRSARVSSAPPPAKPIAPGRATTPDLAKVGMDDYVKTRKAQGARWAR